MLETISPNKRFRIEEKKIEKDINKMKAIGFYRPLPLTDPESLIDLELEKPTPQGRDILVKVKAISVNPVDVKVRASKPQAEHSAHVIGWDASGIVEAIGTDCTLFQPGDQVYYAGDLTRPGTNKGCWKDTVGLKWKL